MAIVNDKFFVFDDVLTSKEHTSIYEYLKTLNWQNAWGSNHRFWPDAWHWNYVFYQAKQQMPAMSMEELAKINAEHPDIISLIAKVDDLFKKNVGSFDILRLYSNCNPYGTNAYIHHDDGDYTAIYYPAVKWEAEWEGGTCFYEQDEFGDYDAIRYVTYKPNRLVIFPAHIPHRGMPVDRRGTDPRYVIAMKMQRNVNDPEYLKEFYGEK
jgi:hypothetical protein